MIITPNSNPNNAEIISKVLEESDEDEENKSFELYFSEEEEIENLLPDLPNENTDYTVHIWRTVQTTEYTDQRKNINLWSS